MAMAKSGSTAKASSARLGRDEWADAALQLIGDAGVAAVAVEPIATSLGITKGSFYWHFRNRDALVEAALARWAQRATADIIATLEPIDDPVEQLRALFAIAFRDAPEDRIEDAILAASSNPVVDVWVSRVNEERLGYLVGCLRRSGFSLADSRHRARIAYATLLGHRMLQVSVATRLSPAALRTFGETLVASITAPHSPKRE
jgi:AcrR family transcriptional regulator